MGGLAALARADGHEVTGSDENVYPPMSTQLESLGIELFEGYDPKALDPAPDLIIVGNALSRGNPAVEYMLNEHIPFTSGPRWLGEHYLHSRRVVAVTGTHGKTTTSSMVAWILEHAGLAPGFLIGGVPNNFDISARAGQDWFVVEADEYDTSFFDKRAKFVHYRPHIAILNNLEFDHADIYTDITQIQTQFNHLMRTIPGSGTVIVNQSDTALAEVVASGCWSQLEYFGQSSEESTPPDWSVTMEDPSGSVITLHHGSEKQTIEWSLLGRHNALNATAAAAAAYHAGVSLKQSAEALRTFAGVKRRLEFLGEINGIKVYDDFAHHPTAIRLTLEGIRRQIGGARLIVALEPASNTMRGMHHVKSLGPALSAANNVFLKTSDSIDWNPNDVLDAIAGDGNKARASVDHLLKDIREVAKAGDHVVFMSNRGFDSAPHRFVAGED